MKLVMEDGWWWRRRRIPLSGASNGSRSALPREFRAWWRLRIVKCDESSSLPFSPRKWIYGVGAEVGGASWDPEDRGRAQGYRARPHPCGQGVGPLWLILSPIFFINSKMYLHGFSGHYENFYFCTKITPWQFCWKQGQSGLVPFKSCKLESKTRAKVFGKVDMMETYHPNTPNTRQIVYVH